MCYVKIKIFGVFKYVCNYNICVVMGENICEDVLFLLELFEIGSDDFGVFVYVLFDEFGIGKGMFKDKVLVVEIVMIVSWGWFEKVSENDK